jgi:hypothetical protein
MSDNEVWFARRFPVGHPRNALAPVSREGWMVAWAFVGAMVLAAVVFIYLTYREQFVTGLILFILISMAAGISFVVVASKKADLTKTLEDYKRAGTGRST